MSAGGVTQQSGWWRLDPTAKWYRIPSLSSSLPFSLPPCSPLLNRKLCRGNVCKWGNLIWVPTVKQGGNCRQKCNSGKSQVWWHLKETPFCLVHYSTHVTVPMHALACQSLWDLEDMFWMLCSRVVLFVMLRNRSRAWRPQCLMHPSSQFRYLKLGTCQSTLVAQAGRYRAFKKISSRRAS